MNRKNFLSQSTAIVTGALLSPVSTLAGKHNHQAALKYHEVSFKASHNSYDRDEAIHDQLKYHSNNPSASSRSEICFREHF